MIPLILAAISMAQKKAQNENAQNQQMAQNLQGNVQIPQQQQTPMQLPTINSIFGNR